MNYKSNLIFNKKFPGIKEKIKFKNICFYKKFYYHYIKSPQTQNIGFYFSYQKIVKVNKIKKKINIPGTFLKYFKKGTNKIPLIKECYLSKFYIIKRKKLNRIEKLKIDLLKKDNQVNIIFTNKTNKKDVIDRDEKNNFSLFDNNTFNSENIKPINIFNVSIINSKISQNKNNKKYQYEKILSLKNNKLSLNNDLLPKKVIEHFKELNEPDLNLILLL